MRIIGLMAENFKILKSVIITPGDKSVIKITGNNEQGKTSVLDVICAAIGGKKFVPDVPVRRGEKRAVVSLDLGELIVTRIMEEGSKDKLKVTNKDGAPFATPQDILDQLYTGLSFDPAAFLKLKGQEQIDKLLSVVDLEIDEERLKQISGLAHSFPVTNPLEKINKTYDFVYKEREDVNRDLKKAEGNLSSLKKVEETDPVSAVELVAEKERLEAQNLYNKEAREQLENERQNLLTISDGIAEYHNQIAELQRKIQASEALEIQKQDEIRKLAEEVDTLQDHDLTDIKERINKIDETNERAQQYKSYNEAAVKVLMLKKDSDDLTSRLNAIKTYKKELISNTKFPVPGLDFGDDGLLLNELPFSQASGKQRLEVSMAIAAALNPKLRVIRVDGGEQISGANWDVIEKFAQENDMQVWTSIVDTSGEVGIIIEDGEVKQV